jgi:hypothetical protein
LRNVLQWFENWVVALGRPENVERVRGDLLSAITCAQVGQPISNVFMSNMHV